MLLGVLDEVNPALCRDGEEAGRYLEDVKAHILAGGQVLRDGLR